MNTIKIISIKYLVLFALIAFTAKAIAQGQGPGTGEDYSMYQTNIGFQAPKIFDASPSVVALMRFEEIPVDGYSGTPSIGIPIFQSKTTSNKVNLDISLSYHATAIAADEFASFTGLGWSLMAGGSISRTVKGYPDEYFSQGSSQDGKKVGIYYRPYDPYGYYSNAYYETLDPANGLTKRVARYKWEAFEQNKFDTEHDLYQYNAMGMSGRFYIKMDTINQELKVVKLDDNRHKIEIDYSGPFYKNQKLMFDFNSFTITNTEGIRFVFEEKEKVIINQTISILQYFNGADNITNSWTPDGYPTAYHLTKVYDETGTLLINFSYIPKEEKVVTYSSTENESSEDFNNISGFKLSYGGSGANFARIEPKVISTETSITTLTKKLNLITIPGLGTIDFSYSEGRTDSSLPNNSGAQKLDEVLVKNINNHQIKRFVFVYDYFNIPEYKPENFFPGNRPDNLKRLILKEVREYGSTNNEFNKYELNYKPVDNPSSSTIIKNPWGYLELDENTLAAKQFVTTGVLSEMTLPTGGRVEYEFEPNTYSYWGETMLSTEDFQTNPENIGIDPNNTSKFKKYIYGGGIRIKEIRTFNDDSNQLLSIRKYEYKEFEDTSDITSSGSLVFQQPKFEFYYGKETAYLDENNNFKVRHFSYTTKTSTNNLSFLRTQGADVGYQYIRILDVNPGDESEVNGRTDNIFRAPQDNPELNDEGFPDYSDAHNIEYPFVPFKNSDFKRGQLKESRVYDKDGRELKITKNNYSVRDESELTTGVRMAIYNGGGCPYAWEYSSFANYMIKYNQSQSNPGGNYRLCGDPSSHIIVYPIRDNMGWLQLDSTETEEYFYNGSTQTVVETKENYTYSDANQQIKTRSVKNSLNEKLEIEYEYPSDLSGQRPWMATLTAENRISEPVVVKIKNLTIGEPLSVQETVYEENSSTGNIALPKHVFMKKGADETGLNYSPTGEDIRATFDKYDTKGNLQQYTLANGTPVSIIWGYNGQYPIAKVEGVEYSEIEEEAFILSNINNLNENSFNALRTIVNDSDKYAMLTCYLYEPMIGITTIIQPNGQKEIYEYDDFGRLETVKDHDENVLQQIEYHYQNQ